MDGPMMNHFFPSKFPWSAPVERGGFARGARACRPRRRCLYWIKLRCGFVDIGSRIRDQVADDSGSVATGRGRSVLTERDAFMLSWPTAFPSRGLAHARLLDLTAVEANGSGARNCVCLRKVWR